MEPLPQVFRHVLVEYLGAPALVQGNLRISRIVDVEVFTQGLVDYFRAGRSFPQGEFVCLVPDMLLLPRN